jgi:hypothetical protein
MSSSVRSVSFPGVRLGAFAAIALFLGGCATTQVLPFTIQSDPLGAHVFYQVNAPAVSNAGPNDWIYLGLTPIDVRREINRAQLKREDAFVLRVVKEGYLDQQKTLSGSDVTAQLKDKGRVFWNPRLVPVSQ